MTSPEPHPSVSDGSQIHRLLAEAFGRTPHLPGGSVEWTVEESVVVLRGQVRTFYLKQLAQSVALKVSGVHRVINEIEVDGSAGRSGADATARP